MNRKTPAHVIFFYSTLLKTLPITVSALFGQLSGLVNSVLTGQFNQIDLAAVSFGGLYMLAVTSLSQGLLSGSLPFLKEAKQDNEQAYSAMLAQLKWVLLIAMVLIVVVFLLANTALDHLGYDAFYLSKIRGYLQPIGLFMLAILIFSFNVNLLIVSGNTKPIAGFGFVATSIDVLTSSLLVFGLFGLPALGATGAALGSLMGSLTIVFVSSYYLKSRRILPEHFRYFALSRPDWRQLGHMLSVGCANSTMAVLGRLSFFVAAILLAGISSQWVAVNHIALMLSTLTLVLVNSSANVVTASFVEIRTAQLKQQMYAMLSLSGGFVAISILLTLIFSYFLEPITALFGGTEAELIILKPVLLAFAVYVVISTLLVILKSVLLAHKEARKSLISQFISLALLFIWLFWGHENMAFDLPFLWWGFCIERSVQVGINFFWITQLKNKAASVVS